MTIAVTPQAPVVNAVSASVAYNSTASVIALNLSGGAPTSVVVVGPPGHGTATASGASISYTPSPGYSGSDSFTYRASNAGGTSAVATVSITVSAQLPVANPVSVMVPYGSSNHAIALNITGGAVTSVAVASPASHGTATASGSSITYTPAPGYSGSDSFSYTASNAGGTSSAATVTITVNPQIPVAGNVALTVAFNSLNNAVPLQLSGGIASRVMLGSAPSHGVATLAGTAITYTPTAGFSGNDSFTYAASNAGGMSAYATVSIIVAPRPDPSKDPEVISLITSQVETAKRFALTQTANFQNRLEGLHSRKRDGGKVSSSVAQERAGSRAKPPAQAFGAEPEAPKNFVADGSSTVAQMLRPTRGIVENPDVFAIPSAKTQGAASFPWSSLSLAGTQKNVMGSDLTAWSSGLINLGRDDSTDTRFTTSGVSVGADGRVSESLVLGFGAGFGRAQQKIGEHDSRSHAVNYAFAIYGSYQPAEGVFIDGVFGHGRLDFDLERYASAVDRTATAQRTGAQWFSSISAGYEFEKDMLLISPYVRADFVSTRLNKTREQGAGIYNLAYFEQDVSTRKLSFGLRGETSFTFSGGLAKPYVRLEYQRDFQKRSIAGMAYADQLSGPIYQLNVDGADRSTWVLGLGSEFQLLKTWNLGLRYLFSQGSSSTQTHTFGISVNNRF